jgi:hypothetical protein
MVYPNRHKTLQIGQPVVFGLTIAFLWGMCECATLLDDEGPGRHSLEFRISTQDFDWSRPSLEMGFTLYRFNPPHAGLDTAGIVVRTLPLNEPVKE